MKQAYLDKDSIELVEANINDAGIEYKEHWVAYYLDQDGGEMGYLAREDKDFPEVVNEEELI